MKKSMLGLISIVFPVVLVSASVPKVTPVVIKQHVPTVVKEKHCIIEALWYEARGESKKGIHAVASVIHNRKLSKHYPSSYCGVIKQRKQFSYTISSYHSANKIEANMKKQDFKTYGYIKSIADKMVNNKFKPSLHRSVLWYTTTRVRNYWTKTKVVVHKIGNHKFYSSKKKG